MSAGPTTIAEAVEWFRKHFRADAAREVSVVYQMELAGDEGGTMCARIVEGKLDAAAERAESPDVVFHLSAVDFFGVLAGTENPDILFMDERIRVDGDLSLALKLRTFFGSEG